MPKIKVPKHSPSIDMTPMVDLAFLLVTFFMLAANFRSNEPVDVETPSSISDKIIPENILMVTIDKGGRIFVNLSHTEARKEMLQNMSAKYKVAFTEKQIEAFAGMSSFGCSMQELPKYIEMSGEERKQFNTIGIPADTTNNQLKDWIDFGNREGTAAGKLKYEEAADKDPEVEMNEFKPKFILKADGKALYGHVKKVIETFRDLDLNNLNFVTSLEAGKGEKQ